MSIDSGQSLQQNGSLRERLFEIYKRSAPPEPAPYIELLERINACLDHEDEAYRPYDSSGRPGGIVYLQSELPTIIVPDLHARMDFFLNMLLATEHSEEGASVLSKLSAGELQVLCLGDGFHAERRALARWVAAYEEFLGSYRHHEHMDSEMRESLGVMEMVMEVKLAFPCRFHFLKGNHENIANEEGGGNHQFGKFALEGTMVAYYIEKFYGERFLSLYARFEKNLPLLAVGRNFLVSHAEPFRPFSREEIIDYRNRPDVVEGLTWTDNGEAEEGSVVEMLASFSGKDLYFGGHRPVRGMYNLRSDGKYVQIHNPDRFIVAYIKATDGINADEDIIEIEDNLNRIYKDEQS